MKRRVFGEGRMAYVLVAVGALMAAAGLYVIGYGWIDARFEEYWHTVSAGSTLIAGGMVTLALGFAVRALLQVKAALIAQSQSVPAPEADVASPDPVPATPEAPAPPHDSVAEAAIIAPPITDLASTQTPAFDPAGPPLTAHREPHPLRRSSRPELAPAAVPSIAELAPSSMDAAEAEPTIRLPVTSPSEVEQAFDLPGSLPNGHDKRAAEPADGQAARAADDYKLETPPTTDHDPSTADEPQIHTAPPPPPPSKSDDWLDRALADIDEELPLHTSSSNRSLPPSAPLLKTEPAIEPAAPALEPAMADVEPLRPDAAHLDAPADAVPPPLTTPEVAIIGRYEADGTSYVMYADGSIEAQSSAGIYRFGSMSELKAFIES